MKRNIVAALVLGVFILTTLSACLIRPPHVPPGQLKKHSAPGQMKKH